MPPPANALFRALEDRVNFESKKPRLEEYKLERMRSLAARAGDPQHDIPAFHVAGSKGKGSTAHYLAGGLEHLGFKTGLYTSPHLRFWAERITRAGEYWPEAAYVRALSQALTLAEDATVFEILTLTAWLLFRDEKCGYTVLETGLGGRLDATNLVRPRVSILTLIELEHTEILGSTLDAIAREKAGIIKPGVPTWTYNQTPEAMAVFSAKAEEGHSPFRVLEKNWKTEWKSSDEGVRVCMEGSGLRVEWTQAAFGWGMAKNAALAVAVLQEFFQLGGPALQGLAMAVGGVRPPGRQEVWASDPPFVLDGAHTVESLSHLAQAVLARWPHSVLVYGSSADKDAKTLAATLRVHFPVILLTGFDHPRAASARDLSRWYPEGTETFEQPQDALERARRLCPRGGAVVVAGSFFLVGAVQKILSQ